MKELSQDRTGRVKRRSPKFGGGEAVDRCWPTAAGCWVEDDTDEEVYAKTRLPRTLKFYTGNVLTLSGSVNLGESDLAYARGHCGQWQRCTDAGRCRWRHIL